MGWCDWSCRAPSTQKNVDIRAASRRYYLCPVNLGLAGPGVETRNHVRSYHERKSDNTRGLASG